jgi:hypothetical protein
MFYVHMFSMPEVPSSPPRRGSLTPCHVEPATPTKS